MTDHKAKHVTFCFSGALWIWKVIAIREYTVTQFLELHSICLHFRQPLKNKNPKVRVFHNNDTFQMSPGLKTAKGKAS